MTGLGQAAVPDAAALPRFDDGMVNLQELVRTLAEVPVDQIMDAGADRPCEGGRNGGDGCRKRGLDTCTGRTALGIPKLRTGSFFPEDVVERYQRVDRAPVAAVAETCATGTSTRKVAKVAERLGVTGMSRDRAGAIAASLGAEAGELLARDLSGTDMPCLWLDATYVKCRREGRAASTAVVTAIGCDGGGWQRVLAFGVVDTESYDSWLGFLRRVRGRGVSGVRLAASDAHPGLARAIGEVFQGAAWQRCVARLMRDCAREAGSRQLRRRVARIVAPVFRGRGADGAGAMCHLACEMLWGCCPGDARPLGEAEPDALAYLDLPASHWKRLRTNNLQERTNREIKRRSRVVQTFPSVASPEGLVGAVLLDEDDAWSRSRYFSEAMMAELRAPGGEPPAPPAPGREAELRLVAEQAIRASLELADRMEAAWDGVMVQRRGRS